MSQSVLDLIEVGTDDEWRKQSSRPLNALQNSFVDHYTSGDPLLRGRVRPAARAAGYSASYVQAGRPHQMMKAPNIIMAINSRIALQINRENDDPDVVSLEARLARITKFDIGTLFKQDFTATKNGDLLFPHGLRMRDLANIDTTCLKSIEIVQTRETTRLKVETYDVISAGRLLLQARGALRDDGPRGGTVNVNINLRGDNQDQNQPPKTISVNPEYPQ